MSSKLQDYLLKNNHNYNYDFKIANFCVPTFYIGRKNIHTKVSPHCGINHMSLYRNKVFARLLAIGTPLWLKKLSLIFYTVSIKWKKCKYFTKNYLATLYMNLSQTALNTFSFLKKMLLAEIKIIGTLLIYFIIVPK